MNECSYTFHTLDRLQRQPESHQLDLGRDMRVAIIGAGPGGLAAAK
jgi:NADPH-dependent glutamate synthase beta subunit-like oxidoreductase